MQPVELEIKGRDAIGTNAMTKVRPLGDIPAVVYSNGADAQSITLNEHEFLKATSGVSPTQLYKFKSEQSDLNGSLNLIKDMQFEPIKDRVLHVDFYKVDESKKLRVSVPVALAGEPTSVRSGIAVLIQFSYKVEIECLPAQIPAELTIDISKMEPGQTIFAAELQLPEGARLLSSPRVELVGVRIGRLGRTEEASGSGAEAGGDSAEATTEAAASGEPPKKE